MKSLPLFPVLAFLGKGAQSLKLMKDYYQDVTTVELDFNNFYIETVNKRC